MATFTFTVTVPGGGGGSSNATFGALTLAGAGGVAVPSGATSITGGTATGYTVTGGFVVPSSNGSATAGTIIFNNGSTWTMAIATGTYSARNGTEANSALNAMGGVGKIVSLRAGNYGAGNYWATGTVFSPRAQIIGEGSWTLATGVMFSSFICNVKNITISNIEIHPTDTTAPFDTGGSADGIILEDCWVHGTYHNPLLDWTAGWVGNGIGNQFGVFTSLIIRRCLIEHVCYGIKGTCDGTFTVEDNIVQYCIGDCVNMGFTGSVGAQTGAKTIQRNFLGLSIKNTNAHADCVQFNSTTDNDSLDYTNIVIRQNLCVQSPALSAQAEMQGIVCFRDSGVFGLRWTNATVCGNVIICSNTHGISIQNVSGGIWNNNTITRPATNTPAVGSSSMLLGFFFATGTIIAKNNVAEAFDFAAGTGTPTYTTARNITLGAAGATNSYSSVFNNSTPTSSPASYTDLLARWAIKVGGPADVVTPKAGALGSGYGVYASLRDSTGWSFNASFEA
jgi:hypothetical protein